MRATIKTLPNLRAIASNTSISVSNHALLISLMIICLIFSAISVIYVKDLNRRVFIQYQALQSQHHELLNRYSQLLLEQGVWSSQSRIQAIATQRFHMVLPDPHHVVRIYLRHSLKPLKT